MSAPTKNGVSLGTRLQWHIVRPCLKSIFAMLRYLAPYLDRQRDHEQATGAFSPELSLALEILDQDRHR